MKKFEKEWFEAMNKAEVSPPEDLWGSIEKELDKPFGFVSPMWFAAAMLFILSFGLLVYNGQKTEPNVVSENINQPSSEILDKLAETKVPLDAAKVSDLNSSDNSNTLANKNLISGSLEKTRTTPSNTLAINSKELFNKVRTNKPLKKEFQDLQKQRTFNSFVNGKQNQEIAKVSPFKEVVTLAELDSKFFNLKTATIALPQIKNKENQQELLASENSYKQKWFGFNSGQAPFSPNLNFHNFLSKAIVSANRISGDDFVVVAGESDASVANSLNSAAPQATVRDGKSISFGFNFGKKLNKFLGFESGLRFLRGSSVTISNVYSYNESTNEVNSFIESEYLDNEANYDKTIISSDDQITNNYDYVSIPLLLTGDVNLSNKLSLTTAAGLSGDLFIQNKSASRLRDVENRFTPNNSNYKSINASFLVNERVNYKVKDHWQAYVGVYYQQSLNTGLKNVDSGSFKPKMLGLNYGVNYLF